jgi:hypothetical protein
MQARESKGKNFKDETSLFRELKQEDLLTYIYPVDKGNMLVLPATKLETRDIEKLVKFVKKQNISSLTFAKCSFTPGAIKTWVSALNKKENPCVHFSIVGSNIDFRDQLEFSKLDQKKLKFALSDNEKLHASTRVKFDTNQSQLIIENRSFTVDDMRFLIDFMKNEKIEVLELKSCHFKQGTLRLLANKLNDLANKPNNSFYKLNTLKITNSKLGNSHCARLANLKNISALVLDDNNIGTEGAKKLLASNNFDLLSFKNNSKISRNILADYKANLDIVNASERFWHIGSESTSKRLITRLDVTGAKLTDVDLASKCQQNATEITLSKLTFNQASIGQLGMFLKNNPQVTTLNLSECVFAREDISKLVIALNKIDTLKTFRLNASQVDDKDCEFLVKLEKIRNLYLENNNITGAGASLLLKNKNISELHLAHNQIDTVALGNKCNSAASAAAVPPKRQSLMKRVSSIFSKSTASLDLKTKNKTAKVSLQGHLQVLDLSHNQLTLEAIENLSDLNSLQMLTELNIGHNAFVSKDAGKTAESILEILNLKGLKKLGMQHCGLSDEVAKELFKVLLPLNPGEQVMPNIELIDLSSNNITPSTYGQHASLWERQIETDPVNFGLGGQAKTEKLVLNFAKKSPSHGSGANSSSDKASEAASVGHHSNAASAATFLGHASSSSSMLASGDNLSAPLAVSAKLRFFSESAAQASFDKVTEEIQAIRTKNSGQDDEAAERQIRKDLDQAFSFLHGRRGSCSF